jgi:2-polyprenyl-3-methyl-5-hydroxy-6-metoxy-1,4-benzoquinol methylase
MTQSPESAACPACGSIGAAHVGEASGLRFHRCGHCDLVFVDPQPRERVRAKYTAEYDLANHFGAWAHRKRVVYERRLAELPTPRPGHDRLCDVGCGDGQFLELAHARGWRVHGVELNPPAAAAARAHGAEVAVGMIEEIEDLPWERFDVVTSWDVLEHTPDPRPFSERLVRLLAPGGTLVVTTLNYDSLVRRCFGRHWSMVCDDHFTYWNARALRMLFEAQGVRLVRARSFGLGRDFVAFVDPLLSRARRPVQVRAPIASDGLPDATWDTNSLVLMAESACNRLLNLAGAGVGLEAAFCRP